MAKENLNYDINVNADGAKTGLAGFKKAVGEAETTTGKFKAGATSAFNTIKANALVLAAAGGAAVATFALKSVLAFTETAKAAVDLGAATGLTTEQASRLIAVADDFEISADALQASLKNITKNLDSPAWEKYGVATRDAGGKARSTNDILLDSLAMLGRVENETERARIGNELFGKGYANLAPMIGKTRAEYVDMLGAVEDGQVVTEKEAAQAEKTRLAFDRMQDSFKEIMLTIGADLAPAFGELADNISETSDALNKLKILDLVGELAKLPTALTVVSKGVEKVSGWFGKGGDSADEFKDKIGATGKTAVDYEKALGAMGDAHQATMKQTDAHSKAIENSGKQAEDYAQALMGQGVAAQEAIADAEKEATEAADKHRESLDAVKAAMDRQTSAALLLVGGDIAVREAQRQAAAATAEFNTKLEEGFDDIGAYQGALDDATSSHLSAAQAIADTKAEQMAANGQTVDAKVKAQLLKEALQQLANGMTGPTHDAIMQLIADINAIPKNTDINVTTWFNTRGDNPGQRIGAHAAGGTTRTPWILAGEHGAELIKVPVGSQVSTASQTRSMLAGGTPMAASPMAAMGGTVVNNLNLSPQVLVHTDSLARWFVDVLNTGQRSGVRMPWAS